MDSAGIRRKLIFTNRLVFWGFGLYLVILAGSLWAMFARPVWTLLFCGIAIAASLAFVIVTTIASLMPRRLLTMLIKHRYMICPRCLQPLDQLPEQGLCPRCGDSYTTDELHWEWAATLAGDRQLQRHLDESETIGKQ